MKQQSRDNSSTFDTVCTKENILFIENSLHLFTGWTSAISVFKVRDVGTPTSSEATMRLRTRGNA